MEKRRRLFFLVILIALIIHLLIFWLVFQAKHATKLKKAATHESPPKEITIERTPPPQVQDLPNMQPGVIPTPANDDEQDFKTKERSESETKSAQAIEQVVSEQLKMDALALDEIKSSESSSKKIADQKKPAARQRAPKPTFNFNQLNSYASALGNSAFKNHGVDREPNEHDLAILLYQEKVRKHFHENWNNYASSTYYYNVNQAQIFLSIVIGPNGRVIKNNSSHNSNNPALLSLLNKILSYAEPFPLIPSHLKIENFEFKITIHLAQGKFSSGYGYS